MSPARLRPGFFIIGANKCGTSSLYRYLVEHPAVLPCAKKEPNFFGLHSAEYIDVHIDEYFALFPPVGGDGPVALEWEASEEAGHSVRATQAGRPGLTTVVVERRDGVAYVTGEGTASTFHEVSPALLHRHLPDTKLIVMMRDPVERAFSHHRMFRRFAEGGYDPGFPVGEFATDVRREMAAYLAGEPTEYVGPGVYVDLLTQWVDVYGRDQVMVVVTEDLAAPGGAARVMAEVESYLGLPAHDYGAILDRRFNQADPTPIDPEIRAELAAFYRPYNDRLHEYLARPLPWPV